MQSRLSPSRRFASFAAICLAVQVLAGPGAVGLVHSAANDFAVSATVAPECVVATTSAMAFGTLSMLNAATGGLSTADSTANATFDAACTNGTPHPTLIFTSATTGEAFVMSGPDQTMSYRLYQDSGHTTEITYAQPMQSFPGFTADGTVKSLTVYGKIEAADKNGKPVGSYSDTVTITAAFGAS